jgi:hypothetical protein
VDVDLDVNGMLQCQVLVEGTGGGMAVVFRSDVDNVSKDSNTSLHTGLGKL